jgi:hypothetical protein
VIGGAFSIIEREEKFTQKFGRKTLREGVTWKT